MNGKDDKFLISFRVPHNVNQVKIVWTDLII